MKNLTRDYICCSCGKPNRSIFAFRDVLKLHFTCYLKDLVRRLLKHLAKGGYVQPGTNFLLSKKRDPQHCLYEQGPCSHEAIFNIWFVGCGGLYTSYCAEHTAHAVRFGISNYRVYQITRIQTSEDNR